MKSKMNSIVLISFILTVVGIHATFPPGFPQNVLQNLPLGQNGEFSVDIQVKGSAGGAAGLVKSNQKPSCFGRGGWGGGGQPAPGGGGAGGNGGGAGGGGNGGGAGGDGGAPPPPPNGGGGDATTAAPTETA